MRRMSKQDRKRWQATTSLHDLGQLTAAWLEGEIASQPGYAPNCGPDPETEELIPVLARANRAGYVTTTSQPGVPEQPGFDDAIWAQRAAVEGWLDPRCADELARTASEAGLLVITHTVQTKRFARRKRGWIDVTRRNGRVVTGFGSQLRRRDVEFQYDECSDQAIDAVLASIQITLADREYGSDQRVWKLLDQWANGGLA